MTKKELRSKLREKRSSIPEEQKKQFDSAILSHILRTELFQKASMILLYVPVEGEVALLELARTARSMGKAIAFPRCDTETETMEFYTLLPESRLVSGAYNIPEPPADAPLAIPDEHTLCIVPGLSFDLYGNRIGYGKGYYDKYLEKFPGVAMGVLYASTMLKRIPTDAHDRPVHCLVTENGMILPERDADQPLPKKKKNEEKEGCCRQGRASSQGRFTPAPRGSFSALSYPRRAFPGEGRCQGASPAPASGADHLSHAALFPRCRNEISRPRQ